MQCNCRINTAEMSDKSCVLSADTIQGESKGKENVLQYIILDTWLIPGK